MNAKKTNIYHICKATTEILVIRCGRFNRFVAQLGIFTARARAATTATSSTTATTASYNNILIEFNMKYDRASAIDTVMMHFVDLRLSCISCITHQHLIGQHICPPAAIVIVHKLLRLVIFQ